MIIHSIYLFVQASSPQYGPNLALDHKLDDGTRNIQKVNHTDDDKEYREHPPQIAHFVDFIVSYSGQRGNRHIQCI